MSVPLGMGGSLGKFMTIRVGSGTVPGFTAGWVVGGMDKWMSRLGWNGLG